MLYNMVQKLLALKIVDDATPRRGGSDMEINHTESDPIEIKDGILRDYFGPNPHWKPDMFRRCYHMRIQLFSSILTKIFKVDVYFTDQVDGWGCSEGYGLLKTMVAVRMTANGKLWVWS